MRLDWNSRVLRMRPMRAHHEIAVAENGDIYTLTSKEETVFVGPLPIPVINDDIAILDGAGLYSPGREKNEKGP